MVVALRQEAQVRAKEMVVTPAMAKMWLEKSAPNRHLSEIVVERYAEDMRQGRWLVNGATIVMGQSGEILDGQHRLHAIVKTGMPMNTIVVSGVADEAYKTMDTGRPRSVGDHLKAMGLPNPSNVAAMARSWLVFNRYREFTSELGKVFSHQEVIATALANAEEFNIALNGAAATYKALRGSLATWAVLWIKFGEIDAHDRDLFFEGLATGANLRTDSPVFALRRYMLEHQRSRQRGLSVLQSTLGALAIKAWNRFRNHQPTLRLQWAADEPYPTL